MKGQCPREPLIAAWIQPPTPRARTLPRPGPATAASLHIPSPGWPPEPRTFPGPLSGRPKGLGGLETLKQAPRFIPEQMRNGKGRPVPGCKQLGPAEGRDKITSRLRTILQTEAHRPGGGEELGGRLGGRPGVFAENSTAGLGCRAWGRGGQRCGPAAGMRGPESGRNAPCSSGHSWNSGCTARVPPPVGRLTLCWSTYCAWQALHRVLSGMWSETESFSGSKTLHCQP